jgi:hypothetical protein
MLMILGTDTLITKFLLNLSMANMHYLLVEYSTIREDSLPVDILGGTRVSVLI